jgi:hypothetical protein
MTDALDAMVKAMISEAKTHTDLTGGPTWVDDGFGPNTVRVDGVIDMVRLARAGLAAIGAASEAQAVAMHEGFKYWPGEGGETRAYQEIWAAGVSHVLGPKP